MCVVVRTYPYSLVLHCFPHSLLAILRLSQSSMRKQTPKRNQQLSELFLDFCCNSLDLSGSLNLSGNFRYKGLLFRFLACCSSFWWRRLPGCAGNVACAAGQCPWPGAGWCAWCWCDSSGGTTSGTGAAELISVFCHSLLMTDPGWKAFSEYVALVISLFWSLFTLWPCVFITSFWVFCGVYQQGLNCISLKCFSGWS